MTAPVPQDNCTELLKVISDAIDAMFMHPGFDMTRHASAVIEALKKAGYRIEHGTPATPPADMEGAVDRRLAFALDEIAIACEQRAHPAGPVLLSKLHVEDMRDIAAKARAALAAALPALSAPAADMEGAVEIVDSELGNIEVDERGRCKWTDVANAQTHIDAQLRALAADTALQCAPIDKVALHRQAEAVREAGMRATEQLTDAEMAFVPGDWRVKKIREYRENLAAAFDTLNAILHPLAAAPVLADERSV